jgi:hypothetical protein
MKVIRRQHGGSGGSRRRWTLGRAALWAVCLVLGAAVAGELGSRYIIGLGDPPLFKLDPEIEYLLVPNQKCRRFGHEFDVNEWSMRSPSMPEHKPAGEFRVLVIGDSLVNGGGRIDQSELATTRLSKGKPPPSDGKFTNFTVGNVSAPSWGPPNELAYAKRFGIFDADVVVIVLNSDDYDDVPGLEYIGSAWPRKKPTIALQELIGVYGWRGLCKVLGKAPEPSPAPRAATHEQDIELCHTSFIALVELIRSKGAKVAVVQYLKKSELLGSPQVGYGVINGWAKEAGVPTISTATLFKGEAAAGRAQEPFERGDDIHPNAHGQELLSRVIEEALGVASGPAKP